MTFMYLTLKDARAELGVSRQWLHFLVTSGQITATKMYGKPLIINDKRFKAIKKARQQ